ncbi:hypothetical protein [Treponema sp.]|uniref:hypothetical protein n=1 Tax=Treponema sp. TaxID=166 RepID=UPI003F0268FB
MRRILIAAFLLAALSPVFAQETDSDFFDDDAIFFDAEDIAVEQSDASDYVASKQSIKVGNSEYFIPLKFTGHLDSNFGFYGTRNKQGTEDDGFKESVYFDFANYIYFMARLDKTLAVHGTTSVKFPPKKDSINLDELYFDYLIWDCIYVTAGKKTTSWGYTRLFSGENSYSLYTDKDYDKLTEEEKAEIRAKIESQGYLYTDILSDSSDSMSGILRIPFWMGNFSAVVLYSGTSTEPGADEISMAGSMEFTVFHSSINFFGRKDPKTAAGVTPLTMGAEIKKTIFGTDLYMQGIGRISDDRSDVSKCVFTGGFYRLWDGHDPNFGINLEFQDSYNRELNKNSCRLYLDMGLKRLGRRKDLKLGLQWQHIIKSETEDDKSGIVNFGVIKSGTFPNAEWKTGIEVRYHQVDLNYENRIYKVRLGSSIQVKMDY